MNNELILCDSVTYTVRDAERVLIGYCFGTRQQDTRPPRRNYGVQADTFEFHPFAYHTYDCVPTTPDESLSILDLFVAAGLNARLDSNRVTALLAVANAVSEELVNIPVDTLFWELSEKDLLDPPEESVGWHMGRAWALMMSPKNIKLAIAHKILHHKRPRLFPLIDRRTQPIIASTSAPDLWTQIHRDLRGNDTQFDYLEQVLEEQCKSQNTPALGRLRIHDILLWCHATNNRQIAGQLGDLEARGR